MTTMAGNIIESSGITDWRVTVTKCSDGSVINTGVFSGTSYSLACIGTPTCNITLSPKVDYAWRAGKLVMAGDYVVAAAPDSTPHLWKATVGATDQLASKVVLACGYAGADNSSVFTDLSPVGRTLTKQGSPIISTAQSIEGGSSMLLDGSSRLEAAASVDFDFGTGDFCLESYSYRTATVDFQFLLGNWNAPSPFYLGFGSGILKFSVANNAFVLTGVSAAPLNQWVHSEVSRINGVVYLSQAGVIIASGNYAGAISLGSLVLGIGSGGGPAYPYPFTGYMDLTRITKGAGRHSSAFTPSSNSFIYPRTGSTEPTWNLSGNTVDGGVTWTYIAPLTDPVTIGPKVPV